MQTEADYYALFEAYQRGELAADARASLEARLGAEPRLQQLYAEYLELTGTLRGYAERRRTRQQIASLHTAMLAAEATPAAEEAPALKASVNPRLRISRTEQKLRDFWNGHRATMGIAASVAVLAVFGTLLGLQAWQTSHLPTSKNYTLLVREVDKLKKNQRALSNALNQQVSTTPVELPSKYSGTGFALTADGYLVTSAHVITGPDAKSIDSLLVEGRDHQRYRAEAVYTDRKHDLAILRIKDKDFKTFGRLPYTFKSGQADLGERVYTLGYPREDVVYGEGALSARSGYDGDTAFYQVSIPLNPGNSGGPLLDAQGNLIGVVNGRQEDALGASFATKSSYLVRLVDSLRSKQPAAGYRLPRVNQLAGAGRPQQLKRLQDYVFVVKVYE